MVKRKRENMGSALTKENIINLIVFYFSEIVRCKPGSEWPKNAVFHNITPAYLANYAGWNIFDKRLNKYSALYATRNKILQNHNNFGKKTKKKVPKAKSCKTKANDKQRKPQSASKPKENEAGTSKQCKPKSCKTKENEAGTSQPRKPKENGPYQSPSKKGKKKVGEPVYSRKRKENVDSVTKSVNNLVEKLNQCKIKENLLINENFDLFRKIKLESENGGKGRK